MIIDEIKKYNLRGRGGAGFPTAQKWEVLKEAKADKKYIICNIAEGEPDVFKDGYILENYPEEIINGINLALEAIEKSTAIIYLRKDYYKKFSLLLRRLIGNKLIDLRKETGGYLCGEETTLLESLEGKREEPRNKPPYPAESGLYGFPTLINNAETFYYVSKISKGLYKDTRFYSISGDTNKPGVYELQTNSTVEQILKKTGNYPRFNFFVQVGGGASGEILQKNELNKPVSGLGAISVHDQRKLKPVNVIKKCVDFFYTENCGKCVPCREGVFRLKELLEKKNPDLSKVSDLLFVLKNTSFCPLGKSVTIPIESSLQKIWKTK